MNETIPASRKFGISGSTLKLIAIISMFIDHLGAAVVARILVAANRNGVFSLSPLCRSIYLNCDLYVVYQVMRDIGRIAFPIFCFLLIEGFLHTHDVRKYALRLLAFCAISEIPFVLAFQNTFLEFHSQNVFFTLLIGLLTMMVCREIERHVAMAPLFRGLLYVLALAAGMGIAELLHTDYSYRGVFCIMMLYFARTSKPWQILVGAISFAWEIPAPAAFLPIALYNGKRGWNIKYFFYLFYPVHLLLLYLLACAVGLGGVTL